MPVTVTLPGPAPWGFRITGGRDFGKPIAVSKVTEHGKAAAGDLRLGDVIVTINGESTAEMLNVEAQNKIKQSPGQLRLQVERSPVPPPSHTNGDTSPEKLAACFQVSPRQPPHTQTLHPGLISAASISVPSPGHTAGAGGEQGHPQSLLLHPSPPQPPTQQQQVRPDPAACGAGGWAGPLAPGLASPSSPPSPLSDFLFFKPKSGSVVASSAAPSQQPLAAAPAAPWLLRLPLAPSFLPSPVFGLVPAPEGPSLPQSPPTAGLGPWGCCTPNPKGMQAVRIQDGRYRHPSCYACADCGLNLKMRGHFWVGDELYCEKHARLRYPGPPGGPTTTPISPQS
ncbi:PDLI2 protein, partial [Aegotheles bennettii]|nr:PDLI2 protein [Aegotheles bennettii]